MRKWIEVLENFSLVALVLLILLVKVVIGIQRLKAVLLSLGVLLKC